MYTSTSLHPLLAAELMVSRYQLLPLTQLCTIGEPLVEAFDWQEAAHTKLRTASVLRLIMIAWVELRTHLEVLLSKAPAPR